MIFGKAGVAQLVEYKLPKLGVAGSKPVARSILLSNIITFLIVTPPDRAGGVFCLGETDVIAGSEHPVAGYSLSCGPCMG